MDVSDKHISTPKREERRSNSSNKENKKKKKKAHTYQEKETAKVRAKKKFSIVKDIRNRAP